MPSITIIRNPSLATLPMPPDYPHLNKKKIVIVVVMALLALLLLALLVLGLTNG